MRVTVIILILSICVIAGCAKKEDNEYVGVGEKVTTDEIKDMEQQQTEKATEDDYSIDKEMVQYYIDDSHFYNSDDGISFALENETEEKFNINILDAYISDNLESFGEYFEDDIIKGEIEEAKKSLDRKGYNDEDITYMCVEVELTNISKEDIYLCMNLYLQVFTRIYDESGKDFGLTDRYIDMATAYTEFWYDSSKKENEEGEYYFVTLSSGETITTKCVYILRKEFSDDELYLKLHVDEGEYNTKYNCVFPPNAETTKFLKINLR